MGLIDHGYAAFGFVDRRYQVQRQIGGETNRQWVSVGPDHFSPGATAAAIAYVRQNHPTWTLRVRRVETTYLTVEELKAEAPQSSDEETRR